MPDLNFKDDRHYWNYRFKNGLTRRQVLFCEKYLTNGHNITKAAFAAGYGKHGVKEASVIGWHYLRGKTRTAELMQKYINDRVEDVSREMQIGFEEKRKKLWYIADTCAPDDLEPFIDKDGRLVQKIPDPKTAVSAIAEMNKMDGDLAAEKRVTVNVTETEYFKQLKAYEKKLLEEKRQEY